MQHLFRTTILLLIITLSFVGCTPEALQFDLGNGNKLSGKLIGYNTGLSAEPEQSILSCASSVVSVYKLNTNGDRIEPELGSTNLSSDGSYSFLLKDLGLTAKNSRLTEPVVVVVNSCTSGVYLRPVTGTKNQDISAGASLISFVLNTTNKAALTQALLSEPAQVEALIVALAQTSTLSEAYTELTTDAQTQSLFNTVFGTTPVVLNDAAPEIKTLVVPVAVQELSQFLMTTSVSHWSTSYTVAYNWKLDGVSIGQTASVSYTAKANAQGTHTIELVVGEDNGSGQINTLRPVKTVIKNITIANNVLPQALGFTITNPAVSGVTPIATRNLTLSLNTGVSFVNCESFSTLAVTENTTAAPAANEFTTTCTQALNQAKNYTLASAGDGAKVLRIWAKDASGQISQNATTATVYLDTGNPTATILTAPITVTNATSQTFTFTGSDNGGSIDHFECKLDAGAFSSCADPKTYSSLTAGAHTFSVYAVDTAGNISPTQSFTWAIDLTPPTISITTPNSDNTIVPTASLANYTVGGACSEEGQLVTLSGVLTTFTSCISNTWSKNLDLSAFSDGVISIVATQVDAAGNSASTSARTLIKDTTLPVIAVSPLAMLKGNTTSGSVTWALTEANMSTGVSFTVEIFDGSNWLSLGQKAVTAGNNNNQAYTLNSWSVPAVDSAVAKIRVAVTDAAGNSNNNQSANFTIDSTAPVLSSVSLNDGATYAGTSLVSVKINLADNFSSGSQNQVRLGLANVSTGSCQSMYADNNWVSWVNATTNIAFTVPPSDGRKKICVWAKDSLGNISQISPDLGINGVTYDEIEFSTGNVPQVTQFTVTNTASGTFVATVSQALTINWAVTDVEALDNNAVMISYTTDNNIWKDIYTNSDINIEANKTWVGGLSGNPTSGSGVITTFTAPTSGYFKFKIQAKDIAGNTSSSVSSQGFNTGNWSVYAGTKDRGDGGTGKSAAIYAGGTNTQFAINPINGDIYAIDQGRGIRKLDAKTGLVSTFIKEGTLNLPESGALPVNPMASITLTANPFFDSKGRLYFATGSYYTRIYYQIDLTNNFVRKYAGGGLADDGGELSTNLQISAGQVFDEQDSLYVFTYCGGSPITSDALVTNTPVRIVKIAQNPDGSPGVTTRIAGNCTLGAKTNGALAINQPVNTAFYSILSQIVPYANGSRILVLPYGGANIFKIIDGLVYSASASAHNLGAGVYNPADGYIYKTIGSGVEKVLLNTAGAGGDTVVPVFSAAASAPGCAEDGTAITNFCGSPRTQIQMRQGILYFADGGGANSASEYSIRYFDGNNQLRTVFGSKPFYGEGLNKNLIRGAFAGIAYKKASDPNQAAFPEGLYFSDRNGMVFGAISATTSVASVLWGNQSGGAAMLTSGTVISKNISMGAPYGGGSGYPLTFDNNGLPWLRAGHDAIKIDQDRKIIRQTNQSVSSNLQLAPNGADPRNYGLYVYGGLNNFTLKNQGLFVLPNYYLLPSYDPVVTIRYMDFTNYTTPIIIGGTYKASDNAAASSDVSTPGLVKDAPLWTSCRNSSSCYVNYISNSDRLYYSEGAKMRYITTPDNTTTATLGTLFILGSGSIYNFAFTPDGSQLWYYKSNGGIYCYDISSGKSWCDNVTDHFTVRSVAGFVVSAGANQFTFKDNQTMFFSTYQGEILQFNLPTTP